MEIEVKISLHKRVILYLIKLYATKFSMVLPNTQQGELK